MARAFDVHRLRSSGACQTGTGGTAVRSRMEGSPVKQVGDAPELSFVRRDPGRHWLVLFHGRAHNFRKDIAVQEKWARHLSAKLRSILLQIGIELPPEFLLSLRHGTIHQGAKHRSHLFAVLHFFRRSWFLRIQLHILDLGCRVFGHDGVSLSDVTSPGKRYHDVPVLRYTERTCYRLATSKSSTSIDHLGRAGSALARWPRRKMSGVWGWDER
jgi:hypothetical protein